MNEVAFKLWLSLVNLLSAGCMLWTKGPEKATKLHSLRLWACRVLLFPAAALVILSCLQLKLASEVVETAIDVVTVLSWTVPPIFEVWIFSLSCLHADLGGSLLLNERFHFHYRTTGTLQNFPSFYLGLWQKEL